MRVRRDGYREGERVEVGSAGQEHVDRVVLAIGVTVTDVNPVVVRRAEVHPCREPLRPFGEQRREAGGGTSRVDLVGVDLVAPDLPLVALGQHERVDDVVVHEDRQLMPPVEGCPEREGQEAQQVVHAGRGIQQVHAAGKDPSVRQAR